MSFPNNITVAIIGASGGIGGAFTNHLMNNDKVSKIYAFARRDINLTHSKIIKGKIDINDEQSIMDAADAITDKCHIIIVATGVLQTVDFSPEKTLRNLESHAMQKVMITNFIGPSLVGKYFLPLLSRDDKSVFAALSARVGSISDNDLGGWYSYRASKAALNMFIKTASVEMARKYDKACIIALHPGTVDTNLSSPFKANVPAHKLFTPEYSAERMLEIIEQITPDKTGRIFAYDGEEINP